MGRPPVLFGGAKMFVITNMDGPLTASLKVTPEEFEELTACPGISPSSHLARYHWLHIANAVALSDPKWKKLVTQSYELVKAKLPKKLQLQFATE